MFITGFNWNKWIKKQTESCSCSILETYDFFTLLFPEVSSFVKLKLLWLLLQVSLEALKVWEHVNAAVQLVWDPAVAELVSCSRLLHMFYFLLPAPVDHRWVCFRGQIKMLSSNLFFAVSLESNTYLYNRLCVFVSVICYLIKW